MNHFRVIFPVGHGGFAFEHIDNTNIIFDCGSDTAPTLVCKYIDILKNLYHINEINYLFISHFDNDHVSCLKYLNNNFKILQVVWSYIPNEFRAIYDIATRKAYSQIRHIFNNVETTEIGEKENQKQFLNNNSYWEWIAKSMLDQNDFNRIEQKLINQNFDITKKNNNKYVESQNKTINYCFKSVFGEGGPNNKGLILLSQKHHTTSLIQGKLYFCFNSTSCILYHCLHCKKHLHKNVTHTSCLFTGDTNLHKRINITEIQKFINSNQADSPLLLLQIPHHGSIYSSDDNIDTAFQSDHYFVNDISDARFAKHKTLYSRLQISNNIHIIRNICNDIVVGISSI